MEEGTRGFEEKLTQLLAEARKRKNVLEYQEIINFLAAVQKRGGRGVV